jgi:hypothetical protein
VTLSPRQRLQQRRAELKTARSSWDSVWRDISEQMLPYRVMWNATEKNRGEKKDSHIINSTPLLAVEFFAAAMMAGYTNPAHQWMMLTVLDDEIAELHEVKSYLDLRRRILEKEFAVSNWYALLADNTYPDLGGIGQSCLVIDEDRGHFTFSAPPIGSYCLDVDHRGECDTYFREWALTPRQMVQRFGESKVAPQVNQAAERGVLEPRTVVHAIVPNDDYTPGRLGPRGKAWSSCWWDEWDRRKDTFLAEGGYERFPVLAPYWSMRSGDSYGRGPGWRARGDCKQLQHTEKTGNKLFDKTADPPMKGRGIRRASLLPGDLTDVEGGVAGLYEPAQVVNPGSLEAVDRKIGKLEDRINRSLYVNLWQAFVQDDRAQRQTATEVEAKRQELMRILGPLLERLDKTLLEPAVERADAIIEAAGGYPMPPEALQGQEVRVKFISIMHQAQQAASIAGIRTMVDEVTRLAQVNAEAADKLDVDVVVDELARTTGVRPDMIVSQNKVDATRRARAEMEQAKQTGEAMVQATQGAKNISGIDARQLQGLASTLAPAAAAQAVGAEPVR